MIVEVNFEVYFEVYVLSLRECFEIKGLIPESSCCVQSRGDGVLLSFSRMVLGVYSMSDPICEGDLKISL